MDWKMGAEEGGGAAPRRVLHMRVFGGFGEAEDVSRRGGRSFQTCIGCCFQRRALSLTSRMSPEVFNLQRVGRIDRRRE